MFERIVVGTDGSETAGRAVDHAIEIARRFDSKLVVVSAYRPRSPREESGGDVEVPGDVRHEKAREEVNMVLTEAAARAARAGVEVEPAPIEGDPVQAILGVAEENKADVIVVGNVGMKGPRRILGSVPNDISHHASCSVFIVNTRE
jgi:nucleotide-binding universal stress UspA family protein